MLMRSFFVYKSFLYSLLLCKVHIKRCVSCEPYNRFFFLAWSDDAQTKR